MGRDSSTPCEGSGTGLLLPDEPQQAPISHAAVEGAGASLLRVSLRHRVTWLVLAFLGIVLVVLDVAVVASLRSRLDDGLVQRLDERARLALALSPALLPRQLASRLSGGGIEARVVQSGSSGSAAPGSAGPSAASSPVPPAAPVGPPRAPPRPGAAQRPLAPVEHTAGGLSLRQDLGNGEQVVLRASLASIQQTIGRLVVVETVASLAVLVLAGLLLGRVVRFALRPLDQVAVVAMRLARGERGGRLAPAPATTEIGKMAAAFNVMVDSLESAVARAEASEAAMRRFLTDASHELRTPVAGIQAATETLLRENPPRARREQLQVALVREVRRVGRLVNDLLDLARLDVASLARGGTVQPALVDMGEVARGEVEQARLRSEGAAISLSVEGGVVVRGDEHALGRILANLLDNASHATPACGQITVRVMQAQAGTVVIEVADTGRGVPGEELERIFERFVRLAGGDTPGRAGSGLGLAIARASARAHGGDVVCLESQVGARFVVTLPAAFDPVRDVPSGRDPVRARLRE